jgi:hypothetical protein
MRVGNHQTIETLVIEDALRLAKFLRNEQDTWTVNMLTKFNDSSMIAYDLEPDGLEFTGESTI